MCASWRGASSKRNCIGTSNAKNRDLYCVFWQWKWMSVVIRLNVPIEMHYTVIPIRTSKVNSPPPRILYSSFKWRKVITKVRWPGWVWAGECFFWYRPTRVVPDKRPLNGWFLLYSSIWTRAPLAPLVVTNIAVRGIFINCQNVIKVQTHHFLYINFHCLV